MLPTKKRVRDVLEMMDKTYGTDNICYLNYKEPWQLLFATILSAQCTDARVNMVTKELFQKRPDLASFASADIKELEDDIHSTGFYHNKAKNIKACAKRLISDHAGQLPSDIDELTSLPGVGRKTANVVRTHIFHEPSIVVDTHVGRVSRRLGLTESKDPVKVEFELMDIVPKDHWSLINYQFIAHGRAICTSRSPKCEICPFSKLCVGP
ncbi:MAG: endonuclease III [Lachnospiraceae bacterium]|nr:endonuclease III [Lachnospiraceae bacterium]